jgi:hypothetical protein
VMGGSSLVSGAGRPAAANNWRKESMAGQF